MNDWSWLSFNHTPVQLKKGAILFNQGKAVENMYYIESGRVKLIRHTRDGDTVILHVGTSGELIAEASLFSDVYHCSAVVDQASAIHVTSRDSVLLEIMNNPENFGAILKLFSRQIRDLRSLIEIRNIRSAQSRILAYLNSIAQPDGRIVMNTSLRDIAYKLGLAHETLYRAMRTLENNGEINRSESGTISLP